MNHYQMSLIFHNAKYVCVHTSQIGNGLKTRVDNFGAISVLRMMVAPTDFMGHQWSDVDPLVLALRYNEYARKENKRIQDILSRAQ